jgi:uncharacterized protein (DUF1330 family)
MRIATSEESEDEGHDLVTASESSPLVSPSRSAKNFNAESAASLMEVFGVVLGSVAVYTPLILAAIKDAGGRTFNTAGGKTIAFTGEVPQRVGIIEWDSLEQAQSFFQSPVFRSLSPQRDKAERYIRQFAVEATSN